MKRARRSRSALWMGPALLLALSGCGGGPEPPGLVLVTIDTCRADRIGCYGARGVETPRIDELASRGVVFSDVTAPAPLTLPSHCSILTGLYPDRHTVRDNGAGRLPDEAETLAEILQREGWRTGAFVSAFPLEKDFGADQGFEIYDDAFSGTALGAAPGSSDDVAERLFYDERLASEVVDAALPWLREAASGPDPFFLWVHFFDPHAMYRPPPHLASRYGPTSYEGEIAFVDEQIGRLLDELGGSRDRVTFVVTADHGESLGEHEELTHGLFLYQSSLEVPWIMAGPGIAAGTRVDEPASLVQVLPTILELLEIPSPSDLDGTALALAKRSAEPSVVHAECLFPRIHYDWAGLRSVRRGDWKYIDAPRPELYDLASDPDETKNVVVRHPELAAELRAEIDRHAARGGELGDALLESDEDTRRRLEALGYVGASSVSPGRLERDLWNPSGRDPKDMVGFFNRLQDVPTLMISGRNEEAAALLTELRDLDPNNRNVLEKLALLRRLEEDWEDARRYCEEILRIDPDDHRTRKNLASALRRLGDPAGAVRAYEEVIARDPSDAEAWGFLGSLASEDGSHREAILALRRAVEIAPGEVDFRIGLARAWQDSGEVKAALDEYDRVLHVAPERSEAVNGKALLLSRGGRPRDAVEVLRSGLPQLSEDVETLNNLAWILTNESIDPEEGYRHARRAAELAPDDPAILDTLGWSAIRSGRPSEAISPLENAWRQTGDAEVRAHLGVALAESGREREGVEHVQAATAERAALARLPEVAKWLR